MEQPILIIGASGLVGASLLKCLRARAIHAIGTHRTFATDDTVLLDLSKPDEAVHVLREISPRAILLPASATNVEACEADPVKSWQHNVEEPLIFVEACGTIPIVYFSSEYVFDGCDGPYGESAPVNPLSAYGRQKQAMERYFLQRSHSTIVRTVHVFGAEVRQKNFAYGVLRALRASREFPVPTDQMSTPTFVKQLANASIRLLEERAEGVIHVVGSDRMSRYDFARLIARAFALDENLIVPVRTDELRQKARRPLNAGLYSERISLTRYGLTGIEEALTGACAEMDT